MAQTTHIPILNQPTAYKHGCRLATALLGTLAILSLQLSGSIAESTSPVGQFFQQWSGSGVALAKAPRYIPPKRRGMPKRTQGGGSRGCQIFATGREDCTLSLTALVPTDHIGLTASARPVLNWYASHASDQPIQIALVEPGVSKPIWVAQLPKLNAGLNQVHIPDHVAELKPGHLYRWTVFMVNPSDHSVSNIVTRGWIERVELAPAQSKQLMAIRSPMERANFLAEAGLWYDALTEYIQSLHTTPHDQQPLNSLFSLFNQVGLSQVIEWEQENPTFSKPLS
ncbi:DUF928 domain-containing protein [Alkalinema pantanalense CENA528]|uniref:DUF928 domain-containing protein n=1 Tax=Alkalinema pantanalense TaxID=1620705 RepID=UPI003D701B1C